MFATQYWNVIYNYDYSPTKSLMSLIWLHVQPSYTKPILSRRSKYSPGWTLLCHSSPFLKWLMNHLTYTNNTSSISTCSKGFSLSIRSIAYFLSSKGFHSQLRHIVYDIVVSYSIYVERCKALRTLCILYTASVQKWPFLRVDIAFQHICRLRFSTVVMFWLKFLCPSCEHGQATSICAHK